MEKRGKTSQRPPAQRGQRRYYTRKKYCRFCADEKLAIDYKDQRMLRSFLTERGKIIPRRISGTCSPHQRRLSEAIKRARNIALLPLCPKHI